MFIQEAAKISNLTKKAVEYYTEQGLVSPRVLKNGYREFSAEDVERLEQIALYRSLGLSVQEIKSVLDNSETLKGILGKRTLELEEEKAKQELLQRLCQGEALESLQEEIQNINSKSIIAKKLQDAFPSYYGKFLSINFSRYLTGKIETKEQLEAFQEMVDFFDNVPRLEIPEDLQMYLDECQAFYSGEEGTERIQQIVQAKEDGIKDIDTFIKENREILEQYKAYKESEEYKNSPAYQFMEMMKAVCTANGYNDRFIPAMRRLSPSYNEYYEQLLKANIELAEKYPELI